MKIQLFVLLYFIFLQTVCARDNEWALSFRAGRDAGPKGHYKIEIADGESVLTNLSTREEIMLNLSAAEAKGLKDLIEKYIHATKLKVSTEKIRDFMEVKFEYSEENKSIEVEFTFPASGVPEDINRVFLQFQKKLTP